MSSLSNKVYLFTKDIICLMIGNPVIANAMNTVNEGLTNMFCVDSLDLIEEYIAE